METKHAAATQWPPRTWLIAFGVFVLGSAIGLVGSDARTLWFDESASISAATRSWEELAALVQHVDLVHAAYYAVLHVWFDVVAYSPAALRALSAVAIGLTAALLVPLGARLLGLGHGILAAAVFLLMPASLSAATNGRSQSFQMLLGVAASLLIVVAIDRAAYREGGWRRACVWAGYGVVAYAGVLVGLWFVFLVVAHAITIGVVALRKSWPWRRLLLPAVAAFAAVFLATVPFALAAQQQREQIDWLREPTPSSAFLTLARDAWFEVPLVEESLVVRSILAVVGGALVVIGGLWLRRERRIVLALTLPWLLVPPAGLLLVSALVAPTFAGRYFAVSVPALAVLIATGVATLIRRSKGVVAVLGGAALLAGGVQGWALTRWGLPLTQDWKSVAAEIREERAADSDARAALLFGVMGRPPLQLSIDYPEDLIGVTDLTYQGVSVPSDSHWPMPVSVARAVERAAGYEVVWYIGQGGSELASVTAALRKDFTRDERMLFLGGVLVEFRRSQALHSSAF